MTQKHSIAAVLAIITLHACPLHAGEEIRPDSSKETQPPSLTMPAWLVDLRTSYTTASDAEFKGRKAIGDSAAFAFDLSIGRKFTLNDSWSLFFSVASSNLYLDSVPGGPIPDEIHTAKFTAGLEYKWSDKTTIRAFMSPSLYRLEDIDSDASGYSGGLLMTYLYSPSLTVTLGVMASSGGSFPVIPLAGVNWKINDQLELQLMIPKPRLLYRITPKWTVFAGADATSATFRTNKDFETKGELNKYNNELADYKDIRAGVGTGFEITRGVRMEVEGGYSIYRQLDYVDRDEEVKFDPSPYATITLKASF